MQKETLPSFRTELSDEELMDEELMDEELAAMEEFELEFAREATTALYDAVQESA